MLSVEVVEDAVFDILVKNHDYLFDPYFLFRQIHLIIAEIKRQLIAAEPLIGVTSRSLDIVYLPELCSSVHRCRRRTYPH